MNKLMKFLTPLIALAAMFLFVSPAQAAPSIPPTEECVGLTKSFIDELFKLDKFDESKERQLFQPLVDAGCLNKNPYDEPFDKMPKAECLSLASEVSAYLAPANQVARKVEKQMNVVTKRLNKQSRAEYNRLKKAKKQGNKAAVKKIEKRLKKLTKKYAFNWQQVIKRNQAGIEQYGASSLLVSLDMSTRGCDPGTKWESKNPGVYLFAYSYWVNTGQML